MALRATIFKLDLHVADMRRGYYGSHALTLARHPSETDERMMLRALAFGLFADERLAFTRGLSTADEPALWRKDLTGALEQWIDLGHPDERRLLQAAGRAQEVIVLCYGGHASRVWWRGMLPNSRRLNNLTVLHVDPASVRTLGDYARRSMMLHASIDEDTVLLSSDSDSMSLQVEQWWPQMDSGSSPWS